LTTFEQEVKNMPRIPEETLEKIKREVSIQSLVEAKGIKLTPHGKNLIGLCPFHDDKDPSLVITPDKNLWHCLGACQIGGSVIDWVMKAEGVSFRHAVEILLNNPDSLQDTDNKILKRATKRKLEASVKIDSSDQEVLRQTIEYYHKTLKNNPDAMAYLKKRGLINPELMNRFKLGFSNRTLGLRLPEKNRKAGAEIRGRLQKIGILKTTGHEHFRGALVVPIINSQGQITEVYGRKIAHSIRKDTPVHLYLPGPHQGIWNEEALQISKEIILCESIIDALTFWSLGHRNVTTSYGIEGFTEDHINAFKTYKITKVLIAYDQDIAGNRAAEKLAVKLEEMGITAHRIKFPYNQDANEFVLSQKKPGQALSKVIRNAAWIAGAPDNINIPLAAKEEYQDKSKNMESGNQAPTPEQETDKLQLKKKPNETELIFGPRRYRIRGLGRNMTYDQLRINILISVEEVFHVDTLDLYSARQRSGYIKQAAAETKLSEEVIKRDIGKVLLKLEELQDEQIKKTLVPDKKAVVLTDQERTEALTLLKDPNLLKRILLDFERCGIIGEENNKLVGFLATVSRKLDKPLAVIIQSSSAAGKTALMEGILAFLPEEEKVKYSAVTGQSLFYMSESDLKHKVLAIVEEEGAEKASYALKLLQSEGELTIASTGKDTTSGRLTTHEYKVEGPVMILLTTTAVEIDEELLNRCIVLTVNEDREQTRAIHDNQRTAETLEGLLAAHDKTRILKTHRNAQRLLRPVLVANPYAPKLTFLSDRTRTRRDHTKYLTLIRTIALLHQYQREKKYTTHHGKRISYIEVTLKDIEVANKLVHDILGRTLDELSPQTRRFLMVIDELVSKNCKKEKIHRLDYRFTRRMIRQYSGWSDFQVRVHLDKLVSLEYLLVHKGGRGQSFIYEMLYDGKGQDGEHFMMGLADINNLENKSNVKSMSIEKNSSSMQSL
jgi:DNA primase catalytic core